MRGTVPVLHTAFFFLHYIVYIYTRIYTYAHQIAANTHTHMYIYTYTFTQISSMYTYMYIVIYIYICAFAGEPLYKTRPFKVFNLPMCAQPTTAAAETLKGILLRSCLRLSQGLNGGHGEAVGEKCEFVWVKYGKMVI